MIDRYGEAIESDLFDRGWDLLDFFRGTRPWAQLVRLVDNLPAWSRTGRAMVDDDELHEWRERRRAEQGLSARPPLRMRDWTEFDELIQTVHDAANAIRITIAQVNTPKGRNAPTFKAGKRPLTAAERHERRKDRQVVADIVAQLLPDGPQVPG